MIERVCLCCEDKFKIVDGWNEDFCCEWCRKQYWKEFDYDDLDAYEEEED